MECEISSMCASMVRGRGRAVPAQFEAPLFGHRVFLVGIIVSRDWWHSRREPVLIEVHSDETK